MIKLAEVARFLGISDKAAYNNLVWFSEKIFYNLLATIDGKVYTTDEIFAEIQEEHKNLYSLIVDKNTVLGNAKASMPLHNKPSIYFLVDRDEIAYIGQSTNFANRVMTHQREKTFDRMYLAPTYKPDLNRVERININHHNPRQNNYYYCNEHIFRQVLRSCCFV